MLRNSHTTLAVKTTTLHKNFSLNLAGWEIIRESEKERRVENAESKELN